MNGVAIGSSITRPFASFFDMHPDYRFLEFNIDLHKPEQLVGALPELKLDPIHYGHLNTTPEALLAKFTNDEVKGAER